MKLNRLNQQKKKSFKGKLQKQRNKIQEKYNKADKIKNKTKQQDFKNCELIMTFVNWPP